MAPSHSGSIHTFIAAPLRRSRGSPARALACLSRIEAVLETSALSAPTAADKLALWTALSEWSAQNLAALDGAGDPAMARGAGAGEIDDESSRG